MFDVSIENRTPFEGATHVQIDGDGQEVLLVILSATFAARQDGSLELAPEQVPVCFGDEFLGEPGRSSVHLEADVALIKPKVDIVVAGAAYAPMGRPVAEVLVSLRAKHISKTLRVTGDRTVSALSVGRAQPFVRMPVVYERAFGGTTDTGDVYTANPVGVGYKGAMPLDPSIAIQAPNVEYPDRGPAGGGNGLPPAGFGVIARHWSSRVKYAGTYDQDWIDSQWPLPPKDFSPLFNQFAPADQQVESVAGGDTFELVNLTSSGLWRFRLPRLDFPLRLIFENRVEEKEVRIDTVLIDAEERKVTLKARLATTHVRNSPRLREVVVGHLSSAWLSAREKGKVFRSLRDGDGTLRGRPTFHL
jgi:hypothetical protein